MIINEMVRMFLASRRRGVDGARKKCADKTIEVYDRNLRIFEGYMAERAVTSYSDMKRVALLEFIDSLEEKVKAGTWSQATSLQLYRCLKAFFRWVDRDEDCQEEKLHGMQKYLPVIPKNPHRKFIPTAEQIRKFRNSFNTKNLWGYRNYITTCLILTNGMRIGEVCNLRLDGLKLDDKTLIAFGKTGPRLVPITIEMVRLLKGWLRRRAEGKYSDSPYVFISKRGEQMDPNGYGNAFRKLVKKHGLAHIHPHTLRHTFCTYYLKNDGNVMRLKDISGHKTLSQLEDYVHLAEVAGNRAHEELERANPLNEL